MFKRWLVAIISKLISEQLLQVTEDDLETLLANDDIVSSETQLLESLIHWYKYLKNQRGQSFKNLVPLIHMSSIPDFYLKFLAEKESIEELNSFTGHQFKAKSSLDDLKRTTHFYNLTILVFFSLSWLSRNILVLLASICWPLVIYYVTILFHSAASTPLVFTGDALYLQINQFNPKTPL